MATRAGARPEAAHPLFSYLTASRPGQPERGRAWAIAVSVGIHVMLLGFAGWAMVAARPASDPRPLEHEYTVDLLQPSVLSHSAETSSGQAPVHPGSGPALTTIRSRIAPRAAPTLAVRPVAARAVAVRAVAARAVVHSRRARAERLLGHVVQPPPGGFLAQAQDPSADELAAGPPRLVPYTQPPELANPEAVRARLNREYPESLQDQGIGGRVVLWFLVDENGTVRQYMMKESSGKAGLDEAAMKVAGSMRFRPAFNYSRHVAVWLALPVLFETLETAG